MENGKDYYTFSSVDQFLDEGDRLKELIDHPRDVIFGGEAQLSDGPAAMLLDILRSACASFPSSYWTTNELSRLSAAQLL